MGKKWILKMSAPKHTKIREINRGGFGIVDLVRLADGTEVAKKTFHPSNAITQDKHDKLRKRFAREVKVMARLNGQGVIPVLDYDLTGDEPWYTMPVAEKTYQEQMVEDKFAGVISQEPIFDILAGLERCHGLGIRHRDLKPANVLKWNGHWYLTDLGLVTGLEDDKTTTLMTTNSVWGTAYYSAPEMLINFHTVGDTVDLYALGVMLHELVEGTPRAPHYQCEAPGHALDIVIRKATAYRPNQRYKNVDQMRQALRFALKKVAPKLTKAQNEWISALPNIKDWEESQARELVSLLEKTDKGDEDGIIAHLDAEHFEALALKVPDDWPRLVASYADWARGGFSWSFTDVIAARMRAIYNHKLSEVEEKTQVVMSTANLGASHNRWHVMGVVTDLAGPSIDVKLAERLAIEAYTDSSFRYDLHRCCLGINRTLSAYHPSIVQAINDAEKEKQEGEVT